MFFLIDFSYKQVGGYSCPIFTVCHSRLRGNDGGGFGKIAPSVFRRLFTSSVYILAWASDGLYHSKPSNFYISSNFANLVSSSFTPCLPKLMVSRADSPLSTASMMTPVPNLAWRTFWPIRKPA